MKQLFATAFQDALDGSMRYDYGGPEPLNALANLRLSQSKPEDAAESAEEAFRRLGLCGGYISFALENLKKCSTTMQMV